MGPYEGYGDVERMENGYKIALENSVRSLEES